MNARIGDIKFHLKGRQLVLTHEEAKELWGLLDDMFAPKGPTIIPIISPCTWPNCPYSQPLAPMYGPYVERIEDSAGSREVKVADGTVFYPTKDLLNS